MDVIGLMHLSPIYANNGTLDLNPLQEALHYPPITSYEENDWKDRVSLVPGTTCSMIGCVIVWVLPPNRTLIIPSTACQVASALNGWTWSWDYACQVFRLSWSVEQWHGQPNETYPLVRYYIYIYIIPETIIAPQNWWLRLFSFWDGLFFRCACC